MMEIIAWLDANPAYWIPVSMFNTFTAGFVVGFYVCDGKKATWPIAFLGITSIMFFAFPALMLALILFYPAKLVLWLWDIIRPDLFWRIWLTDEFRGLCDAKTDRFRKGLKKLSGRKSIRDRLMAYRIRKVIRMNENSAQC